MRPQRAKTMGRAHSNPHSKLGLLLRCSALLAGVWLLLTLAARSGAWPSSSSSFRVADEDANEMASYGGWGFASLGSGSTRRQLQPHEMCSWETAVEVRHACTPRLAHNRAVVVWQSFHSGHLLALQIWL